MEEYQYSDPITGFLKDLFGDFDFDKAQERLSVAESVVRSDFFLSGFADEFVENARWLVSEVFCRIHQRIDISYVNQEGVQLIVRDLSKTLNLSNEDGEKWIVNLIRDSRIGVEAKIDLKSVSKLCYMRLTSEYAAHHSPSHYTHCQSHRDYSRIGLPLSGGPVRHAELGHWRCSEDRGRSRRTRRTRRERGPWRGRTRTTVARCSPRAKRGSGVMHILSLERLRRRAMSCMISASKYIANDYDANNAREYICFKPFVTVPLAPLNPSCPRRPLPVQSSTLPP